MKISHIALYTRNLEKLKDFYVRYFNGNAGKLYHNESTHFSSYFLSFDSDTTLEIMTLAKGLMDIGKGTYTGYTHMAFSVGDPKAVNDMAEKLKNDGYTIVSNPRKTGDGYYESCVLDPDGNRIEMICNDKITVSKYVKL
jgi:lactoylglutathione lyase